MKSIFMINEATDKFQWIGLHKENEDVGVWLATVKFNPVKNVYKPMRVEWLPETSNRDICDFPNFRAQFTTMSDKALNCLKPYINEAGEFLELYGVEVNYTAFHCLTVYDALDHVTVGEKQKSDEFFSLASPKEVLPLVSEKIDGAHIFHIPEVKNKFFVSKKFKDVYEENALTGLDFFEVPLK